MADKESYKRIKALKPKKEADRDNEAKSAQAKKHQTINGGREQRADRVNSGANSKVASRIKLAACFRLRPAQSLIRPASRPCSIAFSRFLSARSKALASLGSAIAFFESVENLIEVSPSSNS